MIRAVPAVAAMTGYALADLGDSKAISLAQNESAFPPSPKALAAGQKALADSALYPDPDWHELRAILAETYPVNAETILCGAGSMELIGCLIRAFAGPGDAVAGTQYGYLFAATATQQSGAAYVKAPEPDLSVCIDAVLKSVTEATRIVFVCNPGNPTGTRIPNDELLRLRASLPENVLLVIDQAYGEFDDQNHAPVFDLVHAGDTVVTRSLSKAYGLAGARVGWGAFPAAIGAEVRKLLNPNNVSAASQAMACAALRDQGYMRDVVAQTAARRDGLRDRLRAAGFDVPPSATNFLLIRFASEAKAKAADAELRAGGLMLRGMGGYGLPDCLRASVGSEEAMSRLGDILEKTA